MIVTTFKDCKRYAGICTKLDRAFSWLQNTDVSKLPMGKTEIEGNEIYANHSTFTSLPRSEAKWEVHHTHLDIQIVLKGHELMDITPRDLTSPVGQYNKEADYQQVNGSISQTVHMVPEQMTIVFPEDAHRPAIHGDEKTAQIIEKLVIKIAL